MYVYFLILGKPLAYGSAESLRFLPESMQIALRETARIRFGKLLQDTCRDTQMTVLLITHNQAITPMADRVITMKNGKIAAMQQNAEPVPVSEIAW